MNEEIKMNEETKSIEEENLNTEVAAESPKVENKVESIKEKPHTENEVRVNL